MKTAYLVDQRCGGDGSDPFLEADRKQMAKQEAAAKRVHPTLHLPAISQPSTQVAGLFSCTPVVSSSSAPQITAGTPSASSGSAFSLFNTPASAPSASTSLSLAFNTPSASAPTSSLFGSSGASPESTLFGSASSSLFGSTPTPSLFGTPAPSFGSVTTAGTSLFSMPNLATGPTIGSGTSFAASKNPRPKSRTAQRQLFITNSSQSGVSLGANLPIDSFLLDSCLYSANSDVIGFLEDTFRGFFRQY